MFQKESVRVEVCKTVMEAFNKLVKCQFEQVEKLLTWYQSPTYCRCGSRILH